MVMLLMIVDSILTYSKLPSVKIGTEPDTHSLPGVDYANTKKLSQVEAPTIVAKQLDFYLEA